jgi:hypothetical protein
MGEAARAHEMRCRWVSNEERRDREVDLVGEVVGQELGVDFASTFDHEPADPSLSEVVEHCSEVQGGAECDDVCEVAEALIEPCLC